LAQPFLNVGFVALFSKVLYMFISYIWVIESSRNKGIATQLYEKVINYAKEHTIKKIWLDIYTSNEKSIRFHNKLGFQPHIMLYSKDI